LAALRAASRRAPRPGEKDARRLLREAEAIAAAVPPPDTAKFQRARALVRAALTEAGIAQKIDTLVAQLLDGE